MFVLTPIWVIFQYIKEKKMKKNVLFVLVVLLVALTACSHPSEVSVETTSGEVETFKFVEETKTTTPYGNFIRIRYYPTGQIGSQQIFVDLILNNQPVCSWDMGGFQPWDRIEDVIYFAPIEGNCPNLDPRNGVIWYVKDNYAELMFEEQIIQEIQIWTFSDKYYLLEKSE